MGQLFLTNLGEQVLVCAFSRLCIIVEDKPSIHIIPLATTMLDYAIILNV